MKPYIIYLIPLMLCLACQVGPEPIAFGKDACEHCRMLIMDPKFGAEIVTEKGRVYKFDDVNCKRHFISEHGLKEESLKYKMVVDFSEPQTLIHAGEAFYVRSEEIKSPMGSQIAAFSSAEAAEQMMGRWREGEVMDYSQMRLVVE